MRVTPRLDHGGEHIHANLESFAWSPWEPQAPPLPTGERSAHEVRRVRGAGSIDRSGPPHPSPLPCGERELTEIAAPSVDTLPQGGAAIASYDSTLVESVLEPRPRLDDRNMPSARGPGRSA